MSQDKFGYSIVQDIFGKDVYAKTENQHKLIQAIDSNTVIFVDGPAGTGKTYLAVAKAAAFIKSGKYEKIILTRPAVEAGKGLGFLPGDLSEKISPYMQPLYEYLNMFFAKAPKPKVNGEFPSKYKRKKAKEVVDKPQTTVVDVNTFTKVIPLEYLRGHTFKNSIIIADESQNIDQAQMILLLTRIGKDSKLIIVGDTLQSDLKFKDDSGFADAINRLADVPNIAHITFNNDDIQRHGIIRDILVAYGM